MKNTLLLSLLLAFLTFKNQAQTTVTDIDGNVYNTVTIGTQIWMKENLKVTHYRNGDSIPNVTDNSWNILSTGAYYNLNNDSNNVSTYGRLYNWYAVTDVRNIAPIGWHVPTDAEWSTLSTFLGGESVAGGKMKEAGTSHWVNPNTGADNSSGFSALPGGHHDIYTIFVNIGYGGYFWSATASDSGNAWHRYLDYNNTISYRGDPYKTYGSSVRCLKDSTSGLIDNNDNIGNVIIYPNPAIDNIFIYIKKRQNIKMQVYNLIGYSAHSRPPIPQ